MKIRKAGLADILSFILIFTLFTAFIVALMFNNVTQERRGILIDKINKETMILQASLEGYSTNPQLCYMYKSGSRLSTSQANSAKDTAIANFKKAMEDFFEDERNKSSMQLDSIDVSINDAGGVKDVATINVTVNYTARFKSPFYDDGVNKQSTSGVAPVKMKDTASRVIENPIRARNTDKNRL